MEKLVKFIVAFSMLGGWFLGFVISINITGYPGQPWFIYYCALSVIVLVSLKFALQEEPKE